MQSSNRTPTFLPPLLAEYFFSAFLSGDTLLTQATTSHQTRATRFGRTFQGRVPEHCLNTANMDAEKKASETCRSVPTQPPAAVNHESSLGSQSKATDCNGGGSDPRKIVNPWYVDLSKCKACGECRRKHQAEGHQCISFITCVPLHVSC